MGMYNSITQEYGPEPCTNCGRAEVPLRTASVLKTRQWWFLNDAHGISGYFCPDCFAKVRHDCFGKPVNPKEYTTIAVKQRLIRSTNAGQ